MVDKLHPHTNSVKLAASRIDGVISRFGQGPRFMQEHTDRTERRHERIDNARPDVQQWVGKLPLTMVEKLARLDED